MARSSIFRTRALWKLLSACAELIDERRAVVPRCCFGHLEGRNNRVVRVSVDHVLNDGVVRLRLVSEARRDVSQNISHIITALPILVVAEPAADEDWADSFFKRQPVCEIALNQRCLGQRPAELARRLVV